MKPGTCLSLSVFLLLLLPGSLLAQKGRYAGFLEKGEKVLAEDYQSIVTKTEDGTFRYRQFFPEKMLLTDLVSFSDKARTTPHGPHLAWYDNGHRKLEANYENGLLRGAFREYAYANDSLITTGQYAYGEKDGEWISYYESGRIRRKQNFLKGKQEGEYIAYDTVGVITEQSVMRADTVYSYVIGQAPDPDLFEVMPQFPGCEEIEDRDLRTACANRKMLEFIYSTLIYPARAVDKGVEGRAEASFVIEKDGSVTGIEVVHGLNSDISREMERIIGKMPVWHPGFQQGEPVRVKFNLPVKFKLQ